MWVHGCGGGGACQRVNILNIRTELGYGMRLEHLILIHIVYLIMPVVQWYHFLTVSIYKIVVYSYHLIGNGKIHSQTPIQHHLHVIPMKVSKNTFPIIWHCKLPPTSISCHKLQCTDSGNVSGFDCICMHTNIHIDIHVVHNTFQSINKISNILSHKLTNIPFLNVYLLYKNIKFPLCHILVRHMYSQVKKRIMNTANV